MTPESYLGTARLVNYVGFDHPPERRMAVHVRAKLPQNDLSYAGMWRVGPERSSRQRRTASPHFRRRFVFIVLGGRGPVRTRLDGKPTGTFTVNADRLYTVVSAAAHRATACSSCGSRPA